MHYNLGRYLSADDLQNPGVPNVPTATLPELIDQALVLHPAIQVALYDKAAARADYKRSHSTDYPQVDLQLQRLVGDDDAENIQAFGRGETQPIADNSTEEGRC